MTIYETLTGYRTTVTIFDGEAGAIIRQEYLNQPMGYILLSAEEWAGLKELIWQEQAHNSFRE